MWHCGVENRTQDILASFFVQREEAEAGYEWYIEAAHIMQWLVKGGVAEAPTNTQTKTWRPCSTSYRMDATTVHWLQAKMCTRLLRAEAWNTVWSPSIKLPAVTDDLLITILGAISKSRAYFVRDAVKLLVTALQDPSRPGRLENL